MLALPHSAPRLLCSGRRQRQVRTRSNVLRIEAFFPMKSAFLVAEATGVSPIRPALRHISSRKQQVRGQLFRIASVCGWIPDIGTKRDVFVTDWLSGLINYIRPCCQNKATCLSYVLSEYHHMGKFFPRAVSATLRTSPRLFRIPARR